MKEEFTELRLTAPAKLNLGLKLLSRRADGFHLLQSLFWPIDLTDTLTLTSAGSMSSEFLWGASAVRRSPLPMGENTVSRALRELEAEGIEGLHVRVEKQIPIGAGLGGGSADAGSLLRWAVAQRGLNPVRAEAIAVATGADVPFFLNPRPTWVEGIGERRSLLDAADPTLKTLCFLVLIPPEGTSTGNVFSAFAAQKMRFSPRADLPFHEGVSLARLRVYLSEAQNDLEDAILASTPVLRPYLEAVRSLPSLYSGFSGTGSTCFAVFDSDAACRDASQAIADFCRSYFCNSFVARTFTDVAGPGEQHGNHGSKSISGQRG